jgi:Phosphotransferase enzyme family
MLTNIRWRTRAPELVLAPTDFAQLADLRDEQIVLGHLRDALPQRHAPARATLQNVWYIPGRNLQAVYQIAPASGAQMICAVDFAQAGCAFEPAPSGSKLLHLERWGARAWLFPGDPQLPAVQRVLAESHSAHTAQPDEPLGDAPTWRLLSYLPGERCVLQIALPGQQDTLIGKIERAADVATRHKAAAQLWAWGGRSFQMPRPLGYDSDTGVRWEAFVSGRRLGDLVDQPELPEVIDGVLSALVNLHQAPVSGLKASGPADVLQRIRRKTMPRIEYALGELAPRSHALIDQLTISLDQIAGAPMHTIHGDLHAANVLVGSDGPTFIDLDSLVYGDAAYDLALLGSRLLLIALVEELPLAPIARLVASIPVRYEQAGGSPIEAARYAWYMAALLLGRQIKTCVRHWVPGVAHYSARLLTWAESLAHQSHIATALVN